MRIGCLQFAPVLGDVDNNLNRADAVLNKADPNDLDLLVLPELAFSGYNFKSLGDIAPFLEHSGSGISSLWARTVALKFDCTVIVGYPEQVDPTPKWPTGPEYYNAAIIVNAEGETVGNYRKTHLFRTDETWALENPRGFYGGFLTGLGQTAIGICMDLNPYKFEAPWHAYEFAFHILEVQANLVILSMAWMTAEDGRKFSRMPQEPDMETLLYWVTRLEPVIRSENGEEVIVVFANRTGVEDDAIYAGTSAVMGIKDGEVSLYGVLGRGAKELLVVDTDLPPFGKLVYRPTGEAVVEDNNSTTAAHGSPGRHNASTAKRGSGSEKSSRSGGDISGDSRSGHAGSESSNKQSPKSKKQGSSRKQAKTKLSLQTDFQRDSRRHDTSPTIHTPTCPSPTPISMRPRLFIPPAESITMKYLEAQFPTPHPLIFKPQMDFSERERALVPHNSLMPPPAASVQILGGDVTITHEGASASTSPSQHTMSHFSDASPSSPKFYWIPSSKLLESSMEARGWTPAAESDVTTFSEAGSIIQRSNANSVLSNRYYPSTSQRPPTRPQGQSSDAVSNRQDNTRSTPPSEPKKGDDDGPDRPSSPKSRNASRSRGPERPGSAMDANQNLEAIAQKLGEIAQRVASAQGRSTPAQGNGQAVSINGRQPTPADVQQMRMANVSQQSIPIGATPGLWNDTEQTLWSSPPRNGSDQATPSQPRSNSISERGRDIERPGSRAAHNSPAFLSGGRRVSRGRDPTATDTPPAARTDSHGGRQSSRRATNSESVEPIDLSQFRLIEEYISPNCPVHGSQSQTTVSTSQERPSTELSDATAEATTTSVPDEASAVARPHTTNAVMLSHEQQSQQPQQRSIATTGRNREVSVDVVSIRSLESSSTSPRVPFEPPTPRAMTLVYDLESAPVPDMSLKCSEKDTATIQISRPKSAVW